MKKMSPHFSGHDRLPLPATWAFLCCLLIAAGCVGLAQADGLLRVDYYKQTCPSAEPVVRQTVAKAVSNDSGIPAALLRLHFHDCFVRGCDASVLLDSTPANTAEKDSPINNPSLNGFDVIDEIKSTLESQCPQVVSCADILAFAARDSIHIAGGFYYAVPAGRRDGLVSKESDVALNLPMSFFDVKQLEENFGRKGLSLEDMVTLSGAHTIGDSHCSAFSDRLYDFHSTGAADPSMDPNYVSSLKTKCPAPHSPQDLTVPLDVATPRTMDNQYYVNLKYHRGLLSSDQALMDRADTASMVYANINRGSMWANEFSEAMVKMGSIEVLTGSEGQIRKSCRVVN